eukprot:CAMPEP_0204512806 /NCGR_PEP_ID=MMETSP0661-20131031/1152_1 /ASSEMBLY_ACC=CAM_ASM_000606 /TAXON_ID=109239 /ORGANISM="Alexandrium margalefi, Strain AMGDE01CS-322" /LENGTH=208 /DNA_ID=CAMNT_0051517937 /DNA_START=18 /DNA_END=645 /DNA_ORIENTATION=+
MAGLTCLIKPPTRKARRNAAPLEQRLAPLLVVGILVAGYALGGITSFVAPVHLASRRSNTILGAIESGKVNVGAAEGITEDAQLPEDPVIACDAECVSLIESCVEDGCDVEAMMKLDAKLADSEAQISSTAEEIRTVMKTAAASGSATQLARMENILSRIGSLRGQLLAMKTFKDSDLVKQMLKAVTVAFGASRPNDYPKVGVSPYTA